MSQTHTHAPADGNARRLLFALLITALFMVVEVIGGMISGSLALIADAGHMLTDTASLLVALLAVYFSRRPATEKLTFGWLRLTTLAAFVNALALMVITLMIVIEAIRRFMTPEPIEGGVMLSIAVLGLLANIVSFWILHRGQEKKNLNVRAAALHVMGDLLGSVGAIIAAIVIMWFNWTPIDPILSILFSCLILRSAWRLLQESVTELLEGAPREISSAALLRKIKSAIPEVRAIHHVHFWSVGEQNLMTLHIHVIPPHSHDALLARIHQFLAREYQCTHATVQLEYQACESLICTLNQPQAAGHQAHGHHHH